MKPSTIATILTRCAHVSPRPIVAHKERIEVARPLDDINNASTLQSEKRMTQPYPVLT